jgi:hypothetical protein
MRPFTLPAAADAGDVDDGLGEAVAPAALQAVRAAAIAAATIVHRALIGVLFSLVGFLGALRAEPGLGVSQNPRNPLAPCSTCR